MSLFSLFDDRLKTTKDLVASTPQNLESISVNTTEQEFALRKIKFFEEVHPKVDYSDFSNFVFFNSAFDYFNITAEKILNEYPFDGSRGLIQAFLDDLDDYQRYLISIFPRHSGHLNFNSNISSSYVVIEDNGFDPVNLRAQSAILSPGSGSLSVEFWCVPPTLTGSNDNIFVLQKVSGSNQDGYSVYFSGSKVYFRVTSGSNTDQISATITPGQNSYISCIYNPNSELISILTGSSVEFPVLVNSSSLSITSRIDLGNTSCYIASGNLTGKNSLSFTGSLDSLKIWNQPLSLEDISGSFNIRQYAQPSLIAHYTFNESGSSANINANVIVQDYSGHRLNGRIQNYYSNLRSSGSLLPFDHEDLILDFNTPEVQSLVLEQQTSGTNYDRNNDNKITNLLPQKFFELEADRNTQVLENFIYILARNFDELKVRIDQFVNVLRQNYGEFDQTPDALLETVGQFWGWEFTGNFLSSNVNQYVIGKNVLHNLENNREIETKLYQIKNEFWKRTLLNLMHLYKTKGTRESIESLLRIYGVNQNFVRLKQFGLRPNVGISTERIFAEKSVPALTFGSGSTTNTAFIVSNEFSASIGTIEARVRFPTTASSGLTASTLSGSVWLLEFTSFFSSSGGLSYGFPFTFGGPDATSEDPFPFVLPFFFGPPADTGSLGYCQLIYEKPTVESLTGTLRISSSEGNLILTGAKVFDNNWYNVAFIRDQISGTLALDVRSIDQKEIIFTSTASLNTSMTVGVTSSYVFEAGADSEFPAEYWLQELRIWSVAKDQEELKDHALNFQSYGSNKFNGEKDLVLHYRLKENVSASAFGNINFIEDVSTRGVHGIGGGFTPSISPYKRFLNEYDYIASPQFGWTEDLVRILPSSEVFSRDAFTGNRLLALEFNMIDALNEDISQIISSLENFNFALGFPASKYRNNYHGLEILRLHYFKRLKGRLNFRIFFDMLEFFDRSFIDLVRRLIPAHSVFLGDQLVVESHMLERPKHEWQYRRRDLDLNLSGTIQIYVRS